MYATFHRFEIKMTLKQARNASHSGACDDDVSALVKVPAIARQLREIPDDALAAELREYGAWDDAQLADLAANDERIVWIAAGNISNEHRAK